MICDTWINLTPALFDRFGKQAILRLNGPGMASFKRLLSEQCAAIEEHRGIYATERRIVIPDQVRAQVERYRPSPLFRAWKWEQALGFSGQIWVKREDLTPSGSHKINTALAQAWYAKQQGLNGIVTDTGAGQWGLALAMACKAFELECVVFMAGHSFDLKSSRRELTRLTGAKVHRSPTGLTQAGLLAQRHAKGDRLSDAMSEAYEFAAENDHYCLGQGCMSFYAPMHQSVIGHECWEALQADNVRPDVLVACAGGGTNLTGFMAPWIERALDGEKDGPRMIAAESAEVPALTRGSYRYDKSDACGLGPELMMFSLGTDVAMPDIHAAGLRYHAKSPLLSLLVHEGIVEATGVSEEEARQAGIEFFQAEGVLPAPESAHAVAVTRRLATEALARDQAPVIALCLSGSGLLDVDFYSYSPIRSVDEIN